MTRKFLSFSLAVVLALCLAACGGDVSEKREATAFMELSSEPAPSRMEAALVNGTLVTTHPITVDETGDFPSVTIPACVFTYPPDGTHAWGLDNPLTVTGTNNSVFQFVIFDLNQQTLTLGERPSTTRTAENQMILFLFYNKKVHPIDVSRECLSWVGAENQGNAEIPSGVSANTENGKIWNEGGHTFINDYFAPMFNRDSGQKPYKIVLGGDSITAGAHGTGAAYDGDVIIENYRRNPNGYCWANLFKAYIEENYNATVTNNAVSGTYAQWWDLRKTELIPADTDLLILTLGTNERVANEKIGLTREAQTAQFYEHLKSIIDYCHANDTMILLCTPLPTSQTNEERMNEDGTPMYPSHVYQFCGVIQRLASEYNMDYFDLYNAIYYHYLYSGIDYDSVLADTLHPNDDLYTVMYYEYLRGFGIAPSYMLP